MEYTLEGFKSLLEKHDWTYEQSDDHRVYLKGVKQYEEILNYKSELEDKGTSSSLLNALINNYTYRYL